MPTQARTHTLIDDPSLCVSFVLWINWMSVESWNFNVNFIVFDRGVACDAKSNMHTYSIRCDPTAIYKIFLHRSTSMSSGDMHSFQRSSFTVLCHLWKFNWIRLWFRNHSFARSRACSALFSERLAILFNSNREYVFEIFFHLISVRIDEFVSLSEFKARIESGTYAHTLACRFSAGFNSGSDTHELSWKTIF